jgi:hypothetical protein
MIKKIPLMLVNALLLPVTLMLFIYNQNARYLSLTQVAITTVCLIIFTVGVFLLLKKLYHSDHTAFVGCLVAVVLIFLYNNIYYKYLFISLNGHLALLAIPAIAYIVAYLLNLLFKKKEFRDLPSFVAIALSVVLVINLFNFGKNIFNSKDALAEYEYKTSFITDDALPAPNVYWVLCDGLLGFDAMERYFGDRQDAVTAQFESRGFAINKGAAFESGHSTRIAIPQLMCPDYCDKYLQNVLADHDAAMKLNNSSDAEMFNARYHNETINAFAAKGYTTISMSIDEDIFFPVTDYFYYVAAHYTSDREYAELPYFIKTSKTQDAAYLESRFFAMHLGDVFLGGIPDNVFNFLSKRNITRYPLTADFDNVKSIVPTTLYADKYAVLINSIYDSLHLEEINEPKFSIIHAFMPHFPLCFDENGNMVKNVNNIMAYPGHHAFAIKTLINIIDMIITADPDAVIVLQSDHGLHGQSRENITKAFAAPDAVLDIWNSVFSAIRVPDEYRTGSEHYATSSPLNLSRYLVNSYVGKNYAYIADE